MVDRHVEGQIEMGRTNGVGVVKDGREVWTEGPRWPEDWPWVANTWGPRHARVHAEE